MRLKCKINEVEYDIVQGATFSDEYNETLDSGSIIISDATTKINNLSPYDRVYIWDLDSNFKKYMLVDGYSEEMMLIDGSLYKYKITLFSEIKALEKVVCPNISITQSLSQPLKRSVWHYLTQFVNAYSPKIKQVTNAQYHHWGYVNKYTLDSGLQAIFGGVFAPELTMTSPTLRDVLSQLMIVKDYIPYVENNVIKGLDISKRNGVFQINQSKHSFIYGSMSSESYTTALRREYSGAISQDNSARMIENLSFRNSGTAFLTFDNLQLETRFPIYKINKLVMCYYKTIKVKGQQDQDYHDEMFLCEQDITPLVLQNVVRNTLAKDWRHFNANSETDISDVNKLAEYRIATLGYDIGSNIISGWGEMYEYPDMLWWNKTQTYIENILTFMDTRYQFGTKYPYNFGYVINETEQVYSDNNWKTTIITPYATTNQSVKLKSVFFKLDYNALYNGAVITSKDNLRRDDIVTNDNSSASLSVLETDGIFQKEKVNRLGNKSITITARFTDYADMVAHNNILGAVYNNDIVIYHRDYSVYENGVDATFVGTYDYVLKNYYTSVWAKLRTYNFMSYGESVKRAEVEKHYLILSGSEAYFENSSLFSNIDDFTKLMSAFTPTDVSGIEKFNYPDKINAGYFTFQNDGGTYYYLSDINSFVAGHSLCFNIKMYDNVSSGVYIDPLNSNYKLDESSIDPKYKFRGSLQKWHLHTSNREDAFIENIGCYICNLKNSNYFEGAVAKDDAQIHHIYTDVLMPLPQAKQVDAIRTNLIGRSFGINKDNKETLDMTFQFEPIAYDDNVLFSQWFMKLNDMLGTFNKFDVDKSFIDSMGISYNIVARWYVEHAVFGDFNAYITISLPNALLASISDEDSIYTPTQRAFRVHRDNGDYLDYSISLRNVINTNASTYISVHAEIERVYHAQSGEIFTLLTTSTLLFNAVASGDSNNKYFKYFFNPYLDQYMPDYISIGLVGKSSTYAGYNTDPANITNANGYADNDAVYYLVPDINSKTYEKNMFILYSKTALRKEVVYDELDPDNLPDNYTITDRPVPNVFQVTTIDDHPCIQVNQGGVSPIGMNRVGSIQYWYKDSDGLLKCVFGVNTRIFAVGETREFYIHASLLTRKDTRVFDSNGNVAGEIVNHAEEIEVPYGSNQYYTPK